MGKSIKDIVGAGLDDSSVEENLPARRVIELMVNKNLGTVAITRERHIVGLIACSDLLRRALLEGVDLSTSTAGDLMSARPYTISMDESCELAKAIMVVHEVRKLVVIDAQQLFCGFVTALDLLQADLAESRELVGRLNDRYYAVRMHPGQRQ